MSSAGNIFLLFSSMTTTTSTRNTFISALKVVEKLCDKSRAIVRKSRKSTRLPTHTCVPTIGRWTGVRLEDHHQLTIHSFVLGQPAIFRVWKFLFVFPHSPPKKKKREGKSRVVIWRQESAQSRWRWPLSCSSFPLTFHSLGEVRRTRR